MFTHLNIETNHMLRPDKQCQHGNRIQNDLNTNGIEWMDNGEWTHKLRHSIFNLPFPVC